MDKNLRSLLLLGKLPKIEPQNLAAADFTRKSAPSAPSAPEKEHFPSSPSTSETVQSAPLPLTLPPPPAFNVGISSQFSTLMPALMTLKGQMIQELEGHIGKLLSLNPSRREAIAQYLDRLSGQNSSPSSTSGTGDAAGGLRRWIEGHRNSSQNAAIRAYFEEVALLFLSQAILLKAWSDRGIRKLHELDIGKLNWALSTALKPQIPVDREGWQFTRPNLYSWYIPSPTIQNQIWVTLEQTRMNDEGPSLLLSISGPGRQAHPEAMIPQGYDSRFFKSIWSVMPFLGLDLSQDQTPIRRNSVGFSPTLRDGLMVRTGPETLSWAGMEQSPFQLMIAELMQLWWGPQLPPLWSVGMGLEAHTRDQLQFALNSPKPSLITRIADMEACDVAFTLEEKVIRCNGRTPESARLREQLDSLPYFKKLKSASTSLGALQACVTMSKLRPGGCLWWAREQPLSQQEGKEVLSFLLDRGKLICEWDFSYLEHQLPVGLPLFPKYLYLFIRETKVEERISHRPLRITLSGQIRSHIEVPMVLEDALQANEKSYCVRGHWQLHIQRSPTSQKDWTDRWPDLASQNNLKSLERLRTSSVPLAQVGTIRFAPAVLKTQERHRLGSFDPSMPSAPLIQPPSSLWIGAGPSSERKLLVQTQADAEVDGFFVLLPDSSWIAPLCAYLSSEAVKNWLDHHAERKGERWMLSEQVMRWIPVPQLLLTELSSTQNALARHSLPSEWMRALEDLQDHPNALKTLLEKLPHEESSRPLRSLAFVRAAFALESLRSSKKTLLSLVSADGRLAWTQLFRVLPPSEFVTPTLHSRIEVSGNLPLNVPVVRIEKVKTPRPGILLSSESGLFAQIQTEDSLLLDMLWEQLENVKHPTWSELVQSLRLPRRTELAQATASDVLRSHARTTENLQVLNEILANCLVY